MSTSGMSHAQSQIHSKASIVTPQLENHTGYTHVLSFTQSPVHSKTSHVTPQLANQTGYDSGYYARGGAEPSRQKKLPALPLGNPNTITSKSFGGNPWRGHEYHGSRPNTQESIREEIRRERQEELDSRLRMVQREMERMTANPGGSWSLRRHRTLGATPGEAGLSVSDLRAEVRLMREQIRLLREQQRSAWAQGLSDDPPPGYTPMETRTRNSREVLLS